MRDDKLYYLAGPMSGIPQFNYPAFDAAAEKLREHGYAIQSPAEMDSPEVRAMAMASPDGKLANFTLGTWGDFLARDVKLIADKIDGIILLPGWYKSRGARLEAFVGLGCKQTIWRYIPRENGFGLELTTPAEIMEAIVDEVT